MHGKPNAPYDRRGSTSKPTSLEHVRIGGWAELCVGEWAGDEEQIVFCRVLGFRRGGFHGKEILLRVEDEVCSFEKTGFRNHQKIVVRLEDLWGSEFTPAEPIVISNPWVERLAE